MDVEKAKKVLDVCSRLELKDRLLGDREVIWKFNDIEVASGYFCGIIKEVSIFRYDEDEDRQIVIAYFKDDDAVELGECGTLVDVKRTYPIKDQYNQY